MLHGRIHLTRCCGSMELVSLSSRSSLNTESLHLLQRVAGKQLYGELVSPFSATH